jgi:hypothetical protein
VEAPTYLAQETPGLTKVNPTTEQLGRFAELATCGLSKASE